MKRIISLFLILMAFSIFPSYSRLKNPSSNKILGSWIWERSINENQNYTSTPQSTGFRKNIQFTEDGLIITYKNGIEIRNSKYTLEKGIVAYDSLQHDLIIFEGSVYAIENITSKTLALRHNIPQGSISFYKR